MLIAQDLLVDQIILRDPRPRAPKVSVILPTYCRRANGLLERALTSVLTQSFNDFELLVMDDGSTDGSFDLIEELRARDPRVIHVRHKFNCGLPALRVNEGIELARGKYLAFQFDDDCWRPDGLQSLVAEADRHAEPTVVAGRCLLQLGDETRTLPQGSLAAHLLYQSNQVANNSVLFPRLLADKFGMYDCHIGIRRLCDWDLWLRYIRYVPFVLVDQIVSEVSAANPNSIGTDAPWDLALFRYLHDIPRDHLLTPARWREYAVDSLRIGEVEIEKEFRRRVYEDHIVPYYLKHRHRLPSVEGFSGIQPVARKTVLYTRNWYEPTHEIAFNHYDASANRRQSFKAFYQQIDQVSLNWAKEADLLLLVRPVENAAKDLSAQAVANETPVGLYLDDDLLTFSEYGSRFDYLAPGSVLHQNLSEMLRQVDAVLCTTRFIAESVQPLNPRLVPHNGCVANEWLPPRVRARDPQKPLRIGYVGTSYRLDEFSYLWDALVRISEEFGDRLIFEFWGLDVSSLPRLPSPVMHRPYNPSYFNFIEQMKQSDFDILLTPLLDYPRPRLGKAPSKYYLTAVAGALGIFSNVPQYASLPDGITCLKPDNTIESWHQALRHAITMEPAQFDAMRARMIEHVREEFTETAQINLHESALRAIELHSKTRAARYADGRPRIVYALHSAFHGGGEIQLWRRLYRAREYGIEPIVVLPKRDAETGSAQRLREKLAQANIQLEFVSYTIYPDPRGPTDHWDETERREIRELLERCRPALVHTVTIIPSFSQVCAELNIPHVTSVYAIPDAVIRAGARRDFTHCQVVQSDSLLYAKHWRELLGVEAFCAREVVPDPVFELGLARHLEHLNTAPRAWTQPRLVISGTIQERKSQLETIEALGRLKREGLKFQADFYGYTHFFPDYFARCQERVRAYNLEETVAFRGFSDDVMAIWRETDIVLSLSTYESFPSAIKEAMAAGILVVATPVGGIPELIIDGVSGILCADISVEGMTEGIRRALTLPPAERQHILAQARRVARAEFHPQRAINDLLTMYNRAIDLARRALPRVELPRPTPTAVAPAAVVTLPQVAPGSPSVLELKREFQIVVERSNWSGLNVLMSSRIATQLTLRVWSKNRRLVRELATAVAPSNEREWVEFKFDPLANSDQRAFILEFALTDPAHRNQVNLFTNGPNSLYCQMRFAR
ncbi:MAG: glycosyltransferase [Chloroflexi bacterium]|nr:glycosyltransferase [Chloroflexota bacterium]